MAGGAGADWTLVSHGCQGQSRDREYRARARPNGGADPKKVSTIESFRPRSIYTVTDIVTDPQYQAREMIAQARDADGRPLKVPGIAPRLTALPWPISTGRVCLVWVDGRGGLKLRTCDGWRRERGRRLVPS